MHQALTIAVRTLAGVIGAFAFYLAFFLYEDEEGIWQNRFDQFWIEVHDRARFTGSTSVALFNKIAESFRNAVNHIFGPKLLSVKSIVASINLSLFGCSLLKSYALYEVIVRDPYRDSSDYSRLIPYLSIMLCSLISLWCSRIEVRWVRWVSITLTMAAIVLLGYAMAGFFFYFDPTIAVYRAKADYRQSAPIALLSVTFSLFSDVLGIAIVRKSLPEISTAPTWKAFRVTAGKICGVIALIEGIPIVGLLLLLRANQIDIDLNVFRLGGLKGAILLIAILNATTVFYCLVPVIVFIIANAHKLLWPSLSRVLYPLSRYKIITNRKLTIPVGTLCLTVAFNLEHIGAKEILKLF